MKIIFFLIITTFCLTSNASYEGTIVVLEAPIFLHAKSSDKIIQYFRKGESIYIYSEEDLPAVIKNERNEEFYVTLDNQGRTAYIPKLFVRIDYNDNRELSYRNIKRDPTDYRLQEPLSETYPFYGKEKWRSSLALGFGSGTKLNYNYSDNITNESRGNKMELISTFTYTPRFDLEKRFFFGGLIYYSNMVNSFTLKGERYTTEEWTRIGVGPYISYDLYQYRSYIISLNGSFLYGLVNKASIKQEDNFGGSEGRNFTSFSITPRMEATLEYKNLLKNISIFSGISFQYEYVGDLKSQTETVNPSWWNNDIGDTIKRDPEIETSIFVGLKFRANES